MEVLDYMNENVVKAVRRQRPSRVNAQLSSTDLGLEAI